MIQLTRRYRFPAAHVLCHDSFTQAQNEEVYGKCANPAGHGHNYAVEVTLGGPRNPRSGRVFDPALLDEIFQRRVHSRFAFRMLNDDPLFRERVPTGENLAHAIHQELETELAARGDTRVVRVCVRETRRNSFAYGAGE